MAVNEIIDQGLRNTRPNPQYAYIAPFYGQAKRVAWDYFKTYTRDLPFRTVNEAELRIDIERPAQRDRIRFMLLGADNGEALRGIYLDGVALDEYGSMPPSLWTEIIRPALADRLGWAVFLGTLKGDNHFYRLYQDCEKWPDWYRAMFKASETNIIPESELAAAKATMSEEAYAQEFECEIYSSQECYYARYIIELEKAGRIREVPYDPAIAVSTYWDLGIGDATSIWFIQRVLGQFHVIDYVEEHSVGLDRYVKLIKDRPYVYDEHFLPHDAAARELGTGKTRQEMLGQLGLPRTVIVSRQNVDDGINAARMVLPKCYFDKVKCEKGLMALRNYRKEWDEKRQVFKNNPRHDQWSHGADAFRVFALGHRRSIVSIDLPREAKNDWSIWS